MKNALFFTILLAGLSIGTAYSQNFDKAKLDRLFDALAQKEKAMSSVTLSKNGHVVYSRAIGYSSISEAGMKPANMLTRYRVGSISKMFTATMILQLVEEGKIKLNTTLDAFFPKIPNANKITIGNLLNHHSGLHNFTDEAAYATYMTQPKTQEQMVAIISKYKADFEPNEKGAYSNSNFVILGYVIEKITKQSYSDNLKQRITSKIGLTNTCYGGKTNLNNNECFSYQFAGGWKQMPETDMSIPGGAGAVVSTPTDLTKFIEALFSLKLVSQSSLNQMKTITDGFGMGMFQMPFYIQKGWGHNGGIDGFGSNLAYFPGDSLAIAYCTNGIQYPMNDILIGILSIYFNRDYSIPTFNTVAVKSEDFDKYLGIYSSQQLPLKITITKDKNALVAQASGQPSFPMEATDKDKFKFDQAGIIIEFNTLRNELILKQGGGIFLFTKDK